MILGGIVICLLAKQSIIGNLVKSTQNVFPLILVYIFAAVPATILQDSGVSANLTKKLLPIKAVPGVATWALLGVFGLSLCFAFLVCSTAMTATLVASLAPTLLAISESTLIYAACFA